MYISNKKNCKPFDEGHGELIYELAGKAVGAGENHSVAHIEMLPGKQSEPHYHPVAEESFYILSGEAIVNIDEKESILKPGDLVVILPHEVHQIRNLSQTENLHFLAICAPAWTPDCSVFTT